MPDTGRDGNGQQLSFQLHCRLWTTVERFPQRKSRILRLFDRRSAECFDFDKRTQIPSGVEASEQIPHIHRFHSRGADGLQAKVGVFVNTPPSS